MLKISNRLFNHGQQRGNRFAQIDNPKNDISNYTATQRIKLLYRSLGNRNINDVFIPSHVMNSAMEIFRQVKEPKNHYLLNTMLKICGYHHQPQYVDIVWSHIQNADKSVQRGVSYELLIKYHLRSGDITRTMAVLKWMECNNQCIKLHGSTITTLISKCNIASDLSTIHRLIQFNVIKTEVSRLKSIQNALIRKFGKLRNVEGAVHVFQSLTHSEIDIVIIQSMMRIFVENKMNQRALDLFHQIGCGPFIHIQKDAASHSRALRACCNLNDFHRGVEIIESYKNQQNQKGQNAVNLKLQTAFIEFYGHFGPHIEAITIFDEMKHRDIIAVGAIMKVLSNAECHEKVLSIYDQYDDTDFEFDKSHSSIHHDAITHSLALKSCGALHRHQKGKNIHHILMKNAMDSDIRVSTALIDFYGHCNDLQNAIDIFHSIPSSKMDTICIGAMMTAFIYNDQFEDALNLFACSDSSDCSHDSMENGNGIRKINICHLAIKSCIGCNDYVRGQAIISQFDLLNGDKEVDTDILNTLIAFYGHFGAMECALDIFNVMKKEQRVIVTFNAMMTAFINNEYHREALDLYQSIDDDDDDGGTLCNGLVKDDMTHCLAIKACECLNDLDSGKAIITRLGLHQNRNGMNLQIANTLIDFYGHCGDLQASMEIFESIPENKKDIVSINAMMASLIGNGNMIEAERIYKYAMEELKLKADCKTFSIRLNACSHSGDVEKAMDIWHEEIKDERMKYDHYIITCLVDCHSRKGLFEEALCIVDEYERKTQRTYYSMWIALLSATRSYNNKQIALTAFKQIKARFNSNVAVMSRAEVLLSHIRYY